MRLRDFLWSFWTDWRYPVAGFCVFHLLLFCEYYLGLGPGLGYFWGLLFVLNGIYLLIQAFRFKQAAVAFVCCTVLLIGGCCTFEKLTSLPEGKEFEHLEYNFLRMGQYSRWIPMGARDISFSYYTGLFEGAAVECTVAEPAFLRFCRRNRYKVRSDRVDVNEYTGKIENVQYLRRDAMGPRFYAHFSMARTGAGLRLYYNRDTGRMFLNYSTN